MSSMPWPDPGAPDDSACILAISRSATDCGDDDVDEDDGTLGRSLLMLLSLMTSSRNSSSSAGGGTAMAAASDVNLVAKNDRFDDRETMHFFHPDAGGPVGKLDGYDDSPTPVTDEEEEEDGGRSSASGA